MNEFLHRLPLFVEHHLLLVVLFLLLLMVLFASQITVLLRKYTQLTPTTLTMLINRENPLLLDLSAYADFEKMHVPGARHVPMSQFDPEHKDLSKARARPVVVIDRNGGGNSLKAASRLVKAGFTRVYVLAGGLQAWHGAQLPVARGVK